MQFATTLGSAMIDISFLPDGSITEWSTTIAVIPLANASTFTWDRAMSIARM